MPLKETYKKTKMTDADLDWMIEQLASDTTTEATDVSENNISPEYGIKIAEALAKNTTLVEFHIASNKIGDEGAAAFAEVLKTNTTIKKLDLGNNEITDEGIEKIAAGLGTNTTLYSLDLQVNKLGNKGLAALRDATQGNTALDQLLLHSLCQWDKDFDSALQREVIRYGTPPEVIGNPLEDMIKQFRQAEEDNKKNKPKAFDAGYGQSTSATPTSG